MDGELEGFDLFVQFVVLHVQEILHMLGSFGMRLMVDQKQHHFSEEDQQ